MMASRPFHILLIAFTFFEMPIFFPSNVDVCDYMPNLYIVLIKSLLNIRHKVNRPFPDTTQARGYVNRDAIFLLKKVMNRYLLASKSVLNYICVNSIN
jgi:hypothetical protein